MDLTEFICEYKEEMLALLLLLYAATQLADGPGEDPPGTNTAPLTAAGFTERNIDGTFTTIPQGNDIDRRISERRKRLSAAGTRRERLAAYSIAG